MEEAKNILVTGANGYVASWIVKKLLEQGHTVHAAVRNPDQTEKHAHLYAMAKKAPGNLKMFAADLLVDGSYAEAMEEAEIVFHTASPFMFGTIKNPENALIKPALKGTENVLNQANKTPTIKRIVVTSSVVAVYGDAIDIEKVPGGIFTEDNWNTTSSVDHQPYPYSKTLAEKRAWEIAKGQSQWNLVTVNPGFVLGPALSKANQGESSSFMQSMGNGNFKMGVPLLMNSMVDVRDLAEVHYQAGFNPKASGRNLAVSDHRTVLEIGTALKEKHGSKFPFPSRQFPKFLVWLVGPTQGLSRQFVSKNVGIAYKFDNSKSRNELGIEYRPWKETVLDHFAQVVIDGLV